MNAQIFQEDGRLYFQMEIKVFPTESELVELSRQAIKETAAAMYTNAYRELVNEALLLSVPEVMQLMGYKTSEPIHRLMDLKPGHPKKLHCIHHEDKRQRKVSLSELKRWATANAGEDIEQRIWRFEKSAKNRK